MSAPDVSGISTIGSAAVTTVGTLAVTGAALKAVGNTTKNMTGSKRVSKSKTNYNVWHGTKSKGSKKTKSMLGF